MLVLSSHSPVHQGQGVTAIDHAPQEITRDAASMVEYHLRNWVTWMHGGERPDGLPKRASGGLENYTSFDSEGWTAWEKLDKWTAEATNAAIESLKMNEQCAIHHAYLHAVYRFNRCKYQDVLDSAKENLKIALRKKNVWLGE